MCFHDLMRELTQHHPAITVAQVRWAISTGKVQRPPLDGSLRFNFSEEHLTELVEYYVRHGGGRPLAGRRP